MLLTDAIVTRHEEAPDRRKPGEKTASTRKIIESCGSTAKAAAKLRFQIFASGRPSSLGNRAANCRLIGDCSEENAAHQQ